MIFSKKSSVPYVTSDQMKKIDEIAVNRFGVEMQMLMENAGRSVAMMTRKILGKLNRQEIVILIGKGNNGGDGLVAARFLSNWGAKVSCIVADHPDNQSDLTKWHVGILKSMYVNVVYQTEQTVFAQLMKSSSLIIDGLLGYSINRTPEGLYSTFIDMANSSGRKILSIDIPSGLNADTGEPYEKCIRASYTLTLALPKRGLLEEKAKDYVGELWVGDIGIPHEVYEFLDMKFPKLFEEKDLFKV